MDGSCVGERDVAFPLFGKHFNSGLDEEDSDNSVLSVSVGKSDFLNVEPCMPLLSNSRGNLTFIGTGNSTVSFNTSLLLLFPVTT